MKNQTIDYYNKNAREYINLTREVSSENRQQMLLKYLHPSAYILDLGCGSGKDSKSFIDKGYQVYSLDGSEQMAKLASDYIGKEVVCKKIEEINFQEEFDAIYASASLLHIPRKNQRKVFLKLVNALKKNGYLYVNYKYGEFEGIREGRYYTDYTFEAFKEFIKEIEELKIVESEICMDELGRGNNWINIILKKMSRLAHF